MTKVAINEMIAGKKKHRKETSEVQRAAIVAYADVSLTHTKIAKVMSIAQSTVSRIIKRVTTGHNLKNKTRTGRPKKLSKGDERFLLGLVESQPIVTAKILADTLKLRGVNVSPETIRRTLVRHNLHARVVKKKPLLTAKHKQDRLEFAMNHKDKPIAFWKNILWSDESKFQLKSSKRRLFCYRNNKTTLYPKHIQPVVKHSPSVMVWGCFSYNGVGDLVFIGGKMTGQSYVDILKCHLHQSATKSGLRKNYIFQQDNDPKHTSKVAKEYFEKIRKIPLKWPSCSPDLNPIEHLWDELDRSIDSNQRNNVSQFKLAIIHAWDAIGKEKLKKLVESMPKRLKAVIESKGGHTKY